MNSIKFYGHGIVWDKERDRKLCEFNKDREYETDDPRTQALLKEAGYLGDYDAEDYKLNDTLDNTAQDTPAEAPEAPGGPTKPDYSNMTLAELKAAADAVGVKYAANISKATLLKRLEAQNA